MDANPDRPRLILFVSLVLDEVDPNRACLSNRREAGDVRLRIRRDALRAARVIGVRYARIRQIAPLHKLDGVSERGVLRCGLNRLDPSPRQVGVYASRSENLARTLDHRVLRVDAPLLPCEEQQLLGLTEAARGAVTPFCRSEARQKLVDDDLGRHTRAVVLTRHEPSTLGIAVNLLRVELNVGRSGVYSILDSLAPPRHLPCGILLDLFDEVFFVDLDLLEFAREEIVAVSTNALSVAASALRREHEHSRTLVVVGDAQLLHRAVEDSGVGVVKGGRAADGRPSALGEPRGVEVVFE